MHSMFPPPRAFRSAVQDSEAQDLSELDVLVLIRRTIHTFLLIALGAVTFAARAQVVPSATGRQLTITAGGLGSAFQPDYAGGGVASTSPNRLYGIGAYVDVKFTRWVQIEAEGRWLRFNQYVNINEDNYLIGPRIPFHISRFPKMIPYGKALIGYGHMNFEYNEAYGSFTDIAFGGGLDYKLSRKFTVRAADFEFQKWPAWVNNESLSPYGLSVGLSYKVF